MEGADPEGAPADRRMQKQSSTMEVNESPPRKLLNQLKSMNMSTGSLSD